MKKESNPSPKKKWARPMLTVLVRGGDRSEGVLASCKLGPFVAEPDGPFAAATGCIASPIYGGCPAITCYDSAPS